MCLEAAGKRRKQQKFLTSSPTSVSRLPFDVFKYGQIRDYYVYIRHITSRCTINIFFSTYIRTYAYKLDLVYVVLHAALLSDRLHIKVYRKILLQRYNATKTTRTTESEGTEF